MVRRVWLEPLPVPFRFSTPVREEYRRPKDTLLADLATVSSRIAIPDTQGETANGLAFRSVTRFLMTRG